LSVLPKGRWEKEKEKKKKGEGEHECHSSPAPSESRRGRGRASLFPITASPMGRKEKGKKRKRKKRERASRAFESRQKLHAQDFERAYLPGFGPVYTLNFWGGKRKGEKEEKKGVGATPPAAHSHREVVQFHAHRPRQQDRGRKGKKKKKKAENPTSRNCGLKNRIVTLSRFPLGPFSRRGWQTRKEERKGERREKDTDTWQVIFRLGQ